MGNWGKHPIRTVWTEGLCFSRRSGRLKSEPPESCLDRNDRFRIGTFRGDVGRPLSGIRYNLVIPTDAAYRWTAVRAVPVLDAAGSIREWIGANTDITERKQAEEARKALDRQRNGA